MEIWARRFFHLNYVGPKHQSDEHNQAGAQDFQCLIWIFWIFGYVGYLLCGLTLISVFQFDHCQLQCFNLITVSFNWSTQLWSTIQQEISSMKLQKPRQPCSTSHGTISIDCTSLSLCLSRVFYLS